MDYRSTEFGVDSFSRFPSRARTDRQTNKQMELNALPHAGSALWRFDLLSTALVAATSLLYVEPTVITEVGDRLLKYQLSMHLGQLSLLPSAG